MIRVILQGGLGNQMFEFAAGFSLANRMQTRLVLDTSMFEVYGKRAWCRPFELDVFELAKGACIESKRKLAVRVLPKVSSFCRQHNKPAFGRWIFEATNWEQMHSVNYELFGYFANYHLFEDNRELLLKAFAFKTKPNKKNTEILSAIDSCESVSVHIRRGDYLNSTNNNIFYHPSVEWYRKGMKEIEKRVLQPTYYFFSDDMEWVRAQFADIRNAVFVDINHGKDAYNDMRLMSRCKHNIVANSSFSWWSAWLNENPEKIVVAPAKYYMDETKTKKYLSQMIPAGWITKE